MLLVHLTREGKPGPLIHDSQLLVSGRESPTRQAGSRRSRNATGPCRFAALAIALVWRCHFAMAARQAVLSTTSETANMTDQGALPGQTVQRCLLYHAPHDSRASPDATKDSTSPECCTVPFAVQCRCKLASPTYTKTTEARKIRGRVGGLVGCDSGPAAPIFLATSYCMAGLPWLADSCRRGSLHHRGAETH